MGTIQLGRNARCDHIADQTLLIAVKGFVCYAHIQRQPRTNALPDKVQRIQQAAQVQRFFRNFRAFALFLKIQKQ